MAKEFPYVDFNFVDSLWPAKTGKYEFALGPVQQRGLEARRYLKGRPEKVIAVVSHSAFLRTSIAPARWANADYRVFDFEEDDESDLARLVQWKTTESHGGAMGRSVRGVMGVEEGDFPEASAG
ncbi:MAG: hypothetical protein M1828_003888 [Chrysothrix sp. TS-e1954]|nr:MAG: hypothetical protein M1828_003888 [Chrysothrix sp. TS-e1954]